MKTKLRNRTPILSIAAAMGVHTVMRATQAIANERRRVYLGEDREICFPLIGIIAGTERLVQAIAYVTDEHDQVYPAVIFNKVNEQRCIISLLQLCADPENTLKQGDTETIMRDLTGKDWANLIGRKVLSVRTNKVGSLTGNNVILLKVLN